jgi:ribonuclease HII
MTRIDLIRRRPDLTFEYALLQSGCLRVAGLDEAGRGAWAGPVTAAAVVLPLNRFDLANVLMGVRDSKQMSHSQREEWAINIVQVALAVGIGTSSAQEVDTIGLIPATRKAMQQAIADLKPPPQHLLIDHLRLPDIELPQIALTRGDKRALSIAAASIIAKVARDRTMISFDTTYPGYGFSRHKGYGTSAHRDALQRLGPCSIHRRSFAPVAACPT